MSNPSIYIHNALPADDDGFQVLSTGTLRAPHSIHMDTLPRMGLPGLLVAVPWLKGMFNRRDH